MHKHLFFSFFDSSSIVDELKMTFATRRVPFKIIIFAHSNKPCVF